MPPCSGREVDLVNFLPNHLKVGEVGEFIKFFEDFLNNMYFCQNEYRNDPSTSGDEYKFLFMAKGGGSANKTMLYQHTKALLNPEKLESFLVEKLKS